MSIAAESRQTLALAFPLMIGQLSQMLLGVADTVMIGHLGVTDLAALTFATSLFHVPLVFGIGLLTGISVFTANSLGAQNDPSVRGSCRHGLYLSLVLGFILAAIGIAFSYRLDLFGQPPEVADRAQKFIQILMASLVPALASIALKNHADALKRPWPPFWIFLGGVALNVILNWVMIYGKLGCPALGLEGAGWATFISRCIILLTLFLWLITARDIRQWVPFHWFRKPDRADIRSLLAIGFPASLQMVCEVAAFSAAGLLMGRFGPIAMAAHQVAITLAATAFMIPLGLSMALTVQMGQARGAGEFQRLRPIALSGWLLAIGYSLLAAVLFLFLGKTMAAGFVKSTEVITLASSLLIIVGIFQLFDSIQVVSSAMLRGLEDAKVPALMGLVAYWFIGLPIAAGFAFGLRWEALGVWWGLAAGLAVAAFTLAPRLWLHTGRANHPS